MPEYNTITFEEHKIIVIIDNNKILWFNAKQICLSLNYKQTKKKISKYVDNEDKIQLKNMNISFDISQQPDSIYINESGLYSLLITSRTEKSKKFKKWITSNVLPELRKKEIFSKDEDINKLLKKINELEKKNKLLQNDLKIEKFPDGAMVYIIEDYDIDGEIYYRLGKTSDMNKRIGIYNTHSIHNKKVVHFVELLCPLQLETCIRSMLYKYRIKNNKDYFKCKLNKIIKAFEKCMESIECVENQNENDNENDNENENQKGGDIIGINNNSMFTVKNKIYKITYYKKKLNEIYNLINISTIL
jgi:prophage antirepressor-like protein